MSEQQRAAIVTGATGGIGRELVLGRSRAHHPDHRAARSCAALDQAGGRRGDQRPGGEGQG
jgi:NAD(P)-dependent dehydrogenase (short-subunit alcohol dehydrogenase family)